MKTAIAVLVIGCLLIAYAVMSQNYAPLYDKQLAQADCQVRMVRFHDRPRGEVPTTQHYSVGVRCPSVHGFKSSFLVYLPPDSKYQDANGKLRRLDEDVPVTLGPKTIALNDMFQCHAQRRVAKIWTLPFLKRTGWEFGSCIHVPRA